MAVQGERVLGVVGMDEVMLNPMAQDKIPEQDIGMQEQSLPQMNPKPEMGAAAAAESDALPRSLPKRLTQVHLTGTRYTCFGRQQVE